jgi:hypothetical protein
MVLRLQKIVLIVLNLICVGVMLFKWLDSLAH